MVLRAVGGPSMPLLAQAWFLPPNPPCTIRAREWAHSISDAVEVKPTGAAAAPG